MRPNRLKVLWDEGKAANNCWLNISSGYVAEIMAAQGWDSVTIDLQHGMIDVSGAYDMLTAISTTDSVPLVRVPWNEPGIIMKMLDAGAYGIVCPMINNGEECASFVGACRYAPEGYRSVGPNRAIFYGGTDYINQANRTVLALAMVETAEALKNLDEICTTPGLDGILIGPSDLGLSLGRKAVGNQTDEVVLAAIDKILSTAKQHGLKAAIFNSTVDYAKQMIEKGFDLVTVTSDAASLRIGTERLKEMQS